MGTLRTVNIIIALMMLAFVAACGAAAPSVPSQIPTSIEYASDDTLIVGTLSTSVGGSISKSSSAGLAADEVYAIGSDDNAYKATIDDAGRFVVVVPTGISYSLAFVNSETAKTLGIFQQGNMQALTMFDKEGFTAAGTTTMDDIFSSASGLSSTDIGSVGLTGTYDDSPTAGLNYEAGVYSSSDRSLSEITADLSANPISYPYTVTVANRARLLDRDGDGQLDIEAASADESTNKSTPIVGRNRWITSYMESQHQQMIVANSEMNPLSFNAATIGVYYNMGYEGEEITEDMLWLTSSNPLILENSDILDAGEQTPVCSHSTSVSGSTGLPIYIFSFLCDPAIASGSLGWAWNEAAEEYIYNNTFTISEQGTPNPFPLQFVKLSDMDNSIRPSIVANTSGNAVTSIEVRFYTISAGTATLINDINDLTSIAKLNGGGLAWLQVNTGSQNAYDGAILTDGSSTSATISFDSLNLGNISYVFVSIKTIGDDTVGFKWQGL